MHLRTNTYEFGLDAKPISRLWEFNSECVGFVENLLTKVTSKNTHCYTPESSGGELSTKGL